MNLVQNLLSRRAFLTKLASYGFSVPLIHLIGCGGAGVQSSTSQSQSSGANSQSSTGTPTVNSSIDKSKWATGGTGAMATTFPNPFADTATTGCSVTCQATAGPCYLDDSLPPERVDASEGFDGLPMRLTFLLLDSSCQPLVGASVEIWHVTPSGLYSGKTPNQAYCSNSNKTAISANWFRAIQKSDSTGVVSFNSCFPGWYTGRTIHIHVRVRISNKEYVTTQFFFPDEVTDDIIATQTGYKDRGARDTTNENDAVVSASASSTYSFSVQQLSDGSMLASKVLTIRKDTATSLCTMPAGSGGPSGRTSKVEAGPWPGEVVSPEQ